MLWLSGADLDTLAKSPRDIHKFQGLGGIVLTTATMACVSCTFALTMGVRAPLYAAIPTGFAWGLAILNLDRWLVTAAKHRDRWHQNLVAVLPRLVLALIIGTVISTPLVLRIFQNEINAELEVIHQRKLNDHETSLQQDARFNQIPAMETKVAQLRALVNGSTSPGGTQDAEVARLQDALKAVSDQYDEASRLAICEYDGTCGTQKRGDGTAFKQRQQAADELRRRRDAAKADLDAAKGKQQTATNNERDSAAKQLPKAEADLNRLTTLKKQEEDAFNASTRNDSGLLARLEALGKVTERNSTLRTAYLVLLIFITSIEVLPVLTKFLMNCGPPSAYDTILAAAERADVADAEREERLLEKARDLEEQLAAKQDALIASEMEPEMLDARRAIQQRKLRLWRHDQLNAGTGKARRFRVPGPRGGRNKVSPSGYRPFPPPEAEVDGYDPAFDD